jgi:uncharacterized protein (TIGR03086 family)
MPLLDLGPAASEVSQLLTAVSDEQLDGPTPCGSTSVAGLLDHFMGLSLAFTWAARKSTEAEGGGQGPSAAAEHLDPDWRALLPRRLDELAQAWRDPAAWEGMAEAGGATMPSNVIGVVALDELVLHGWDLARATGQSFSCDPASTEAVLSFTTMAAQPERAANREGLFGPVVEVPADSAAFDQALGLAGRDPAWTPSTP